MRYREEIVLGHEDWEFVLRLAAYGVRGEAAKMPTVRYRKWGFNRSDAVDYAPTPFDQTLADISPFGGEEEAIKSADSPSLTLATLHPVRAGEARDRIASDLAAQSSLDVELFGPAAGSWEQAAAIPCIRRLPAGSAADPMTTLRRVREAMRGSLLGVSADPALALLGDPGFVEKVLRRFESKVGAPQVIAFVDIGAAGRFDFRVLDAGEFDVADAHAVVWQISGEAELPDGLHADPADLVGSIARLFATSPATVEWRHAPAGAPVRGEAAAEGPSLVQPVGKEAVRTSSSGRSCRAPDATRCPAGSGRPPGFRRSRHCWSATARKSATGVTSPFGRPRSATKSNATSARCAAAASRGPRA